MSETTDRDLTALDLTACDLTAPDLADPRLARAKRAARLVGLFVPLGLVAVEVVVFLVWLPRLPDEIAVHWTSAGVADGFGSPILTLVLMPVAGLFIASLFFATRLFDLKAKLSPGRGGAVWGPVNRLLPAIILSSAVAIFMLGIITTWLQLDLADGRDLAPNAGAMIVPWAVALPVGVLGYLVQPKLRVRSEVASDRGEPLVLAREERVAWLGAVAASKAYLWVMASSLVVTTASLILALSLRPLSPTVLIVSIVALAAVLALAVTGLRFNVRIDARGFEARSFIGWPVVRAAASNVADVAVGEVAPFAEFGGWGLRLSVDGKVGIVMRRGEGLRIERRTGRPIVVTLDDAAAAAAALATAAEAADTRAEGGTA